MKQCLCLIGPKVNPASLDILSPSNCLGSIFVLRNTEMDDSQILSLSKTYSFCQPRGKEKFWGKHKKQSAGVTAHVSMGSASDFHPD